VHLLTSIHFMMDAQMPSRVVALGQNYRYRETHEVPDTVNAVLEYPEGFTVNLSSTFNNQSASESGFDVLGTEASLVLRDGPMLLKPENVVEGNGWVVSSWPEALEKAYYDDPKVKAEERPGTWTPRMRKTSEAYDEVGQDATEVHVARFFDSVRSGKPVVEDGETGHRAAAAAHMVNLSLRQGRPLEWNGGGVKAT
jgi:predicted dehydrogenase